MTKKKSEMECISVEYALDRIGDVIKYDSGGKEKLRIRYILLISNRSETIKACGTEYQLRTTSLRTPSPFTEAFIRRPITQTRSFSKNKKSPFLDLSIFYSLDAYQPPWSGPRF